MRKASLTLLTAAASAAVLVATTTPALAVHEKLTVTGLTANDRLVTFLADTTTGITSSVKVTGLGTDDLVGIDYRPATGGLYGVGVTGDTARLYLIDAKTGAAALVSPTATFTIGGEVSIDFNPTVDRLRVVSTDGTNLRVNPITGALAATDSPLVYPATATTATATATIAGVAYTGNDVDPATGTQLFDIDSALDVLALQDPPNAGVLTVRGALPRGTKAQATGFDIYTRDSGGKQDWAFVSLFDKGSTTIYEINLTTGAATTNFVGNGAVLSVSPHLTDIALPVDQGAPF